MDSTCQAVLIGTSSQTPSLEDINISVFPNPTQGMTRFMLKGYFPEDGRLIIYDLHGRQIIKRDIFYDATVIDFTEFEKGLYLYKLYETNRLLMSGKLIRI